MVGSLAISCLKNRLLTHSWINMAEEAAELGREWSSNDKPWVKSAYLKRWRIYPREGEEEGEGEGEDEDSISVILVGLNRIKTSK